MYEFLSYIHAQLNTMLPNTIFVTNTSILLNMSVFTLVVVLGILGNGSLRRTSLMTTDRTYLLPIVTAVLVASSFTSRTTEIAIPLVLCGLVVTKVRADRMLNLHYAGLVFLSFLPSSYLLNSIVLLDLLSLCQAIIVFVPLTNPYILFQVLASVCVWVSIVNTSPYFLVLSLYVKLGLSVGAMYLPSLYRQLSAYDLASLAYIGSSNLTIMLYVNNVCSHDTVYSYLEPSSVVSPLTTSIVLHASVLPVLWILSGQIYAGILPYTLAVSTTLYCTASYVVTISNYSCSIHAFIVTGVISYVLLVFSIGISSINRKTSLCSSTLMQYSDGDRNILGSPKLWNLVQTNRSEYGGRNSSLCVMFPVLVCTTIVYVCYVCHSSHPDSYTLISILCSWSWMILSYLHVITVESRVVHTALSRSSAQTAFAWLVLLELSFFFGAIWMLSVCLTHSSYISPSLTSGSISIEQAATGLHSQVMSSQLDSGVLMTPSYLSGKQTGTLHLAYTSLCVLLAVTLLLQYVHRSCQVSQAYLDDKV